VRARGNEFYFWWSDPQSTVCHLPKNQRYANFGSYTLHNPSAACRKVKGLRDKTFISIQPIQPICDAHPPLYTARVSVAGLMHKVMNDTNVALCFLCIGILIVAGGAKVRANINCRSAATIARYF